jgi:hypothetical protein
MQPTFDVEVLADVRRADALPCSCGDSPELTQPERAGELVLGACECGRWCVFMRANEDDNTVIRVDLGLIPQLVAAAAAGAESVLRVVRVPTEAEMEPAA